MTPRHLILLGAFFLFGGCIAVLTTADRQTNFHTDYRHDVRYFRTTQVQGTVISQTDNRVLLQPFQTTTGASLPPIELRITDSTELTITTEKATVDGFVSSQQTTVNSLSLQPGDIVRAFFNRDAGDTLNANIMRKIEIQKL